MAISKGQCCQFCAVRKMKRFLPFFSSFFSTMQTPNKCECVKNGKFCIHNVIFKSQLVINLFSIKFEWRRQNFLIFFKALCSALFIQQQNPKENTRILKNFSKRLLFQYYHKWQLRLIYSCNNKIFRSIKYLIKVYFTMECN